jgi:RNA polymerase sigma-70 factor (ECF subfamily)
LTATPAADPATLRAAANGDADALARLYAATVDALYAYAFYRMDRDAGLAQDVVHDTLLDALRHADLYDEGRGSVHAWVLVRARNVARSRLRDHRRGHELAAAWSRREATLSQIFQSMDDAPLSEDLLARAETREVVHMAMAGLATNHREVLTRKYVHGDSLHELGGRLGLSEDAVKSLLARARRAFRDAFAALRSAEHNFLREPIGNLREVRDVP